MSQQQLDPNGESVQNALETLVELEETGTLDDLSAAANLISLAAEAVDEDMVRSTTRAVVHAGELFDSAAGEPEAIQNLELFTAALSETASDPADPPEQVGPITAARKLNDPKVKRGMGFMIQFLSELGDQLDTRARRYDFDTGIDDERI